MKTRREFLVTTTLGLGLAAVGARGEPMGTTPSPTAEWKNPVKDFPERGPQVEAALAKRFIIAAHSDLAAVQEMLSARPELVNATWDWGRGDFESGLGAAAHMGRKDIALHLLEHNARLDLFAAAMLDLVEVVRGALTVHPGLFDVPGPHGISLLAHANYGKAGRVLDFLGTFRGP
jgi:hypothetical protein